VVADVTSMVVDEPGTGRVELWALPTDESTLHALLTEVLIESWEHVAFGPCIQGAVYEVRASRPPHEAMFDGYLTIAVDGWHFHVCIGDHRGAPPELARLRRTARAELFRILGDQGPVSWGLRMFNGAGEQQITVWLPNPFLDDRSEPLDPPDWSRLTLWDRLRALHLGLGSDPADRRATRFVHG
jgi:hypothetical protein